MLIRSHVHTHQPVLIEFLEHCLQQLASQRRCGIHQIDSFLPRKLHHSIAYLHHEAHECERRPFLDRLGLRKGGVQLLSRVVELFHSDEDSPR